MLVRPANKLFLDGRGCLIAARDRRFEDQFSVSDGARPGGLHQNSCTGNAKTVKKRASGIRKSLRHLWKLSPEVHAASRPLCLQEWQALVIKYALHRFHKISLLDTAGIQESLHSSPLLRNYLLASLKRALLQCCWFRCSLT